MIRWTIAAALCLAAAAAQAQQVKPEDAVKMRQGLMVAMDWQLAAIGAVSKGEAPFSEDLVRRSNYLVNLVKLAPEAFLMPSGSDVVKTSKAKPVVWQDKHAFSAGMRELITEAERLQMAVQSRKGDELKRQFDATTRACKACHDKYRAD